MEEFLETPEHRVSIWEGMAVTGGAILIVIAGLVGLGVKALSNAFDSQRAEAIARSLMTYEIPGGSRGFFGANIGGGKMAVISSTTTLPLTGTTQQPAEVELFLARLPLTEEIKTEDNTESSPQPEDALFSGFSFSYQDPAAFQVKNSRVEKRLFCGATTAVEIQEGTLVVDPVVAPVPAVKYEVKQPTDAESDIVVISALGNQAANQAAEVFDSLICEGTLGN